jgi:hypothetical protein
MFFVKAAILQVSKKVGTANTMVSNETNLYSTNRSQKKHQIIPMSELECCVNLRFWEEII